MTIDNRKSTIDIRKLDQLISAIKGYPDPRRASDEWKQVYRILQKANFPAAQLTGIVGMRDLARLMQTIDQLRAPPDDAASTDASAAAQPAAQPAGANGAAGASGGAPTGPVTGAAPAAAADADTLRRAMKAFKKRLKLTRLDDESRLGHGAMTKGEQMTNDKCPMPK